MESNQADHSPERTAPFFNGVTGQMEASGPTPGPYEDTPRRGDVDQPGEVPDEIAPDPDGIEQPDRSPDEIEPDDGDITQPGASPDEIPPSEL